MSERCGEHGWAAADGHPCPSCTIASGKPPYPCGECSRKYQLGYAAGLRRDEKDKQGLARYGEERRRLWREADGRVQELETALRDVLESGGSMMSMSNATDVLNKRRGA